MPFTKNRKILLTLIAIQIILTVILIVSKKIISTDDLPNDFENYQQFESQNFIQDSKPMLAPGIPEKKIPSYSVENFHYVSVHQGEKQWRIEAKTAFLYNPEQLVHARDVVAYLYDLKGEVTLISGLEAKYFLNQKNLEIFGQVKTLFPDGFETTSDYLQYLPQQQNIQIPSQYRTLGQGKETENQIFSFISMGLDYKMNQNQLHLLKDVKVSLEKTDQEKTNQEKGVPNLTTIQSDDCWIDRNHNLAKFFMNPERPSSTRFVLIHQPTLFTKSRRASLRYGNFTSVLQYITAYEDVLIEEVIPDQPAKRYATGGRADFDTFEDIIQITEFPQAYQNEDTVTGDRILLHRDTGIIEIKNSNAFSTGQENP